MKHIWALPRPECADSRHLHRPTGGSSFSSLRVRRSINRKPDDRISDQASPIMRRSFVLIMSESLVLPRFMLARMLQARLSCANYEDEPPRDFHAVDPRLPIAPRGVAGT